MELPLERLFGSLDNKIMIDLLSPYRKRKVIHESRWRLLASLFSILTILILFLSVTLYLLNRFSAKIISEEKAHLQNYKSELFIGGLREGEINIFNDTMLDIKSIYRNSVDVIDIIESLRDVIPSGSRIDSFRYERSFDDQDNVIHTVTVTGYAPEWQSLLEIEKNLKERFEEVTFSPDTWIQLSDINFSVNLKVR